MCEYADCSFCGGEVREQKTQLEYHYKKELYIFKEVPSGVCIQCGEKYLRASVAKKIEEQILANKNWPETLTVPVGIFSEQ